MKVFDLENQVAKLMCDSQIVNQLLKVEYFHGRLYKLPNKIKLNRLHDFSKRRSVTSSNEIEGIHVSKKQEEDLFINNLSPDTNEAKQLLGYNEALEHIFDCYQYQSLDEKFIKYLHELEWKLINPTFGGEYRVDQNYIREYLIDGSFRTVFIPLPPREVSQAMGNLIWQFNEAINKPNINRLVLIFVFILDFLCIHPFSDGNGRISRLLTTFLLLKYGYELDRYYSISYLILKKQSVYYIALELSSLNWKENNNNYQHFVNFMLSIILEGYQKLDYILTIFNDRNNLENKIITIINDSNEPLTKNDFEEILFSNTRDSIEQALGKLIKNKRIQLIQKGKYSKYWKVN